MTAHDWQIASVALIVDDDPGSIAMVSNALEESGTTVLVARDGVAALKLLKRVDPDVILLDAMMPKMDGFELCRRMKAPPAMTEAPIIFMTGLTGAEDVRRGLSAGSVDYVTRPVNVDELIARVTTHILNARQIHTMRDAFDVEQRAIFAASGDGVLEWMSPAAAVRLTRDGIQVPEGHPIAETRLRDWIRELRGLPVSSAAPFSLGDLTFRYLGRSRDDLLLIRIDDDAAGPPTRILVMSFGLTEREAEVLVWLTQGKTNRDIAEILSLSARTVNKHLEQVFQKLGVDNRTAAAIRADRAIGRRRDEA